MMRRWREALWQESGSWSPARRAASAPASRARRRVGARGWGSWVSSPQRLAEVAGNASAAVACWAEADVHRWPWR